MLHRVRPYMGGYIRYTKHALIAVTMAVILSVVPYFLLYQIIAPLLSGQRPEPGFMFRGFSSLHCAWQAMRCCMSTA